MKASQAIARIACLADIQADRMGALARASESADRSLRVVVASTDVIGLGRLGPRLLVIDVDALAVDRLETLRQLRFVLPDCVTAVYTSDATREWTFACHLAGANAMLSKASSEDELATGIRGALLSGCYTDPRCAVA